MKKVIWVNREKYGERPYVATHTRGLLLTGRRTFVLTGKMEDGQKHELHFRSHFAAKKRGWERT